MQVTCALFLLEYFSSVFPFVQHLVFESWLRATCFVFQVFPSYRKVRCSLLFDCLYALVLVSPLVEFLFSLVVFFSLHFSLMYLFLCLRRTFVGFLVRKDLFFNKPTLPGVLA